jgi:hypothetical protein
MRQRQLIAIVDDNRSMREITNERLHSPAHGEPRRSTTAIGILCPGRSQMRTLFHEPVGTARAAYVCGRKPRESVSMPEDKAVTVGRRDCSWSKR